MTTAQVAQSAERRPNRVAGPIEPASLAQGTLEPAAFPTLDADDIRRLPGETFLIEGLVPTPTLVLLAGPSGIGKSFLLLDWACIVAAARDESRKCKWNGRKVGGCKVLYIAGEGSSGMRNRLKAWETSYDFVSAGTSILFIVDAPNFGDPEDVARLEATIVGLGADVGLVIIDTFSATAPGLDENHAGLVSRYFSQLRRLCSKFGLTVIVAHHTGHNKKGPRGSTVFSANVDTVLELAALPKVAGGVKLVTAKQRDADPTGPILLERTVIELGGGTSSCVFYEYMPQGPSPEPKAFTKERQVLHALREVTRVYPNENGAPDYAWLDCCLDKEIISKRSFYRVKKSLIQSRQVQVIPYGGTDRRPKYFFLPAER
jgi:hypothetical protein